MDRAPSLSQPYHGPCWVDGGLQRAAEWPVCSGNFYGSRRIVGPGETLVGEGRMKESGQEQGREWLPEPKATVPLTFQATEQKAEAGGLGGSPPRGRSTTPATSPTNQGGLSPSPLSIRQLKERVTNLRGKHKQIYNLVVKEVDPQVNWEALVEEKLVRPGLQLGWGL